LNYIAGLEAGYQGFARDTGKLEPVRALDPTPKALLIIHGTFSKSDVIVEELLTSKEGLAFLQKAEADYQQVLTFDHPTLSISPVLNALDLERALAGCACCDSAGSAWNGPLPISMRPAGCAACTSAATRTFASAC